MKKTLIALAVLGTAAGVAHAQSNVTIYGVMDTGYAYQSGAGWRMSQNQDSKIGFRGVEDLGNGLKATFELERRFNLGDGNLGNNGVPNYRGRAKNGTSSGGKDWDGAANIGLAGNWGRVRFGRVNELSTETIRKFDPFYQYGVGSMLWSSQRSARIDNTARYDSPKWAGFSFGLSYSLGKNTKEGGEMHGGTYTPTDPGMIKKWQKRDYDNDGYGVNLSYDNYGFTATGNWSRLADSDDSYVWNLGVGYKFGPAKVTLLYEKTDDKGFKNGNLSNQYGMGVNGSISGSNLGTSQVKSEQEVWLLGLEWDIGPGQFDASVQYGQLDDVRNAYGQKYWNKRTRSMQTNKYETNGRGLKADDADIFKYAIGYTYNLSKRTSAYAQVSYTDYDNEAAGVYYTGTNRDDNWGFQVGMTHKF